MSFVDMSKIDMENRDPNGINDHLRVSYSDVIAEPEGAHSNDCLWRISYRCFTGGMLCCYRCMTIICGMCIALYWGCEFACISFRHVWCLTPQLRTYAICCGMMQKFWGIAVQCCLGPICEASGLACSHIRVVQSGEKQDLLAV